MLLAIALLATLSALANAHSDPGDVHAVLPKLVGGRKFMANLKSRDIFSDTAPAVVQERAPVEAGPRLEARFTQTCGAGVGNCDAGYCCAASGYCGTTSDYCAAPDCQFQYGPACDANTVPAGASTSSIARPQIGNVPYGGINTAGIQDCINPNVMAFSFDDGPYLYTSDLLDLLDKYDAKATFFITGNNLGKGEIDNCNTGYPELIQRMYNSGHQVASHTWSHQDLSTLTTAQFNNQMYYNEMALRNILGFFPTYMRPPYSSCDAVCSDSLANMGYHVTYFDLDTQDYLNDDPVDIQKSKDIFANAMNGVNPSQNDYLVIEHDIHYQTVYNLTEYMLVSMIAAGWGAPVTVGDCLGDPATNWYRSAGAAIATCAAGTSTGTTSTPPAAASSSIAPTGSQVISTDGSCGGTGKMTCLNSAFGNCCSQYGWCGSTSDYCSSGCQPTFGTCGGSASSVSGANSSQGTGTSVSTDGTCGGAGKMTCLNSAYGNCCSRYGWCGKTTPYCGTGCQNGFGTCS